MHASLIQPNPPRARGLTIVEIIVALVVAVIVAGVLLVILPVRSHSCGSRQLRDSTTVRALSQSLISWAGNNNGQYPLPSLVDIDNTTVPQAGTAKDTTANIFSLMIYNGFISPEICVSYVESNTTHIMKMENYALSNPSSAVVPKEAFWDPAFSADFTNSAQPGNMSYAHLLPSGPRLELWKDTFSQTQAVIGNRGPEVASVSYTNRTTPKITWKNPNSNTFLIHGGRSTWEGNIAYNDNHVNFETHAAPQALTFKTAPLGPLPPTKQQIDAAPSKPDVLFYDEPDDAQGQNLFLSIFTSAGDKPSDFKAIWD